MNRFTESDVEQNSGDTILISRHDVRRRANAQRLESITRVVVPHFPHHIAHAAPSHTAIHLSEHHTIPACRYAEYQ